MSKMGFPLVGRVKIAAQLAMSGRRDSAVLLLLMLSTYARPSERRKVDNCAASAADLIRG